MKLFKHTKGVLLFSDPSLQEKSHPTHFEIKEGKKLFNKIVHVRLWLTPQEKLASNKVLLTSIHLRFMYSTHAVIFKSSSGHDHRSHFEQFKHGQEIASLVT